MRSVYKGSSRSCEYFGSSGPSGVLNVVLQIAIDTAVFPEGTSGHQLDVLARKALWKDGMNYMVSVRYLAAGSVDLISDS